MEGLLLAEDELAVEELSLLEVVLLVVVLSDDFSEEVEEVEAAGPLAAEVEERESVMYQPLPLNTMPTG